MFKRIFPDRSHWLKWWLTSMPDKWWRFSEDDEQVERSLMAVLGLLEERGLPWLEVNSDEEAMRQGRRVQ